MLQDSEKQHGLLGKESFWLSPPLTSKESFDFFKNFWVKKIRRNIQRDDDVKRKLSDMGWYSITIWECQLKPKMREQTLNSLSYTLNYIYFGHQNAPDYTIEKEESMLVAEDLSDGYGMDE